MKVYDINGVGVHVTVMRYAVRFAYRHPLDKNMN